MGLNTHQKNIFELQYEKENLVLDESCKLLEVSSEILTSQFGKYCFALVVDPTEQKNFKIIIDLEKDYSLDSINLLKGEIVNIQPTSSRPRLKPLKMQPKNIQEILNFNLLGPKNNISKETELLTVDHIERLVMSLAQKCNELKIPACVAILFPTNPTNK